MKKFIVVLVVFSFISFTSFAQRSRMRQGVKTAKQVKRSLNILNNIIADYHRQIEIIRKKDEKILKRLKYQPQSQKNVLRNDSIRVVELRSRIGSLENQIQELTASTLAIADQKFVYVRGKAMEVANAYLYINSVKNKGLSPANDTAVVANYWHRPVSVTITGPGGFSFSTYLRKGEKEYFPVRAFGSYTIKYGDGYQSRLVVAHYSPLGTSKFQGKKVAFFSFLPE